jgi:hypothetical protein
MSLLHKLDSSYLHATDAPLRHVMLLGGAGALYWRGAMDEDAAGKIYANYLLHRTVIRDACAAGCWA